MALILSIESATSICSVALHQNGFFLGLIELNQENVHAKKLILLIESLFKNLGFKTKDLDAVAVSSGPGSYTGLRIGVSIAKGLAYAHDIPLIGVDTLRALAHQVIPICSDGDFIIPLMDARRMEIYMSILSSKGEIVESSKPLIVEDNPFLEYLQNGKVYFLGDGVEKLKRILDHPNAVFSNILNSSRSMGELAFDKYQKSEFESLAYFEPNYLKEFRVIASKKNPLII
ncbi:tRNA (adenosine(37)-N6)-threonylcarbamoyltransferase complex dimerization subunit type 1 TsaB [Aquiflexum sp.]|uniref:tRNA (adenosine(37)-N6)-threonylcarbamoyltransferase complex dimerization subunit type 1 TsaB n=1 Tax=Aquiflexum sp. TaxID=1872584 RepID=UPI003593BC32